MTEVRDMELLRDYVQQGSEPAFAELVRRHLNLVYSVALRHTQAAVQAEEISQIVFIILARKAGSLRPGTILEGWLHETTRLTALSFLRGEHRRQFREQEAYMQSTLQASPAPETWNQLAPLLDEAISQLGKKDRDALMLRFFAGKSVRDVAAGMSINEAAAQRRVHRAVEKLRRFFTKRGVAPAAGALTALISAHSVQAAPAGLAQAVTLATAAKGAAAGTSTLTLVKGALKFMAWTKAKIAIITGTATILAVGTTTITLKAIQTHRNYSWQVPKFNNIAMEASPLMAKTPPQVLIVPSKYSFQVGGTPYTEGEESMLVGGKIVTITNQSKSFGIGVMADEIVETAYGADSRRTIFKSPIPRDRYDYMANLPHDALIILQGKIRKQLGLVGKWELVETNVLVLRPAGAGVKGFKPAKYFGNSLEIFRQSLENIIGEGLPVINQTGLTNRVDFSFTWPQVNTESVIGKNAIKAALLDQLGLELVPRQEPVEMLVVERVK